MFRFNHVGMAVIGAALLSGCAQTGNAPSTSQTAQVASLATPEASGPWRPFSADSPWNRQIPAGTAYDPDSDVLAADFGNQPVLYINMPEWSVAVHPVDSEGVERRFVRPLYEGYYGRGFGPRKRVPIPDGASPAGPDGGTAYMVLEDRAAGAAWEMRQAGQDANGAWFAGFGSKIDLNGSGVNPVGAAANGPHDSTSPRPSGAPLIAGLIRVEDVKAGRIDHALAFGYKNVRTDTFVSPASTALKSGPDRPSNAAGLPFGTRIQLDPSYDIENTKLSPEGKVIARALQEYGAILVDEADGFVLYAEASPAALSEWNGLLEPGELHMLFTSDFMSKNFRILDIDPASAGQ
jgi:hypothetical protein